MANMNTSASANDVCSAVPQAWVVVLSARSVGTVMSMVKAYASGVAAVLTGAAR